MVASADRVLITGLVHVFKGVGPLVGATTTEAEALSCLRQNAADLLVCSDQLDAGGQGASLVAKAKQQQPQLRCLMLIRRPLLSTIEAAIAAGCDGLCSHERVGNGGLLSVLQAMERQMKAEREKRAAILESEGERQAAINVAEGEKQAKVLAAEADRAEQILTAEGEAKAIEMVADAKAMALRTIGEAAATEKGQKAVQLDLATGAIEAKRAIAKDSTVVLMDGKSSEAGQVVAEAIAIVSAMNKSEAFSGSTSSPADTNGGSGYPSA